MNTNKMFELYNTTVGDTISYHKTLKGALDAMRESIEKVTPALCRDYETDDEVDFDLTYSIKSFELKE